MIFHIASMYAYVVICVSVDISGYLNSGSHPAFGELRLVKVPGPNGLWQDAVTFGERKTRFLGRSTWPVRPFFSL